MANYRFHDEYNYFLTQCLGGLKLKQIRTALVAMRGYQHVSLRGEGTYREREYKISSGSRLFTGSLDVSYAHPYLRLPRSVSLDITVNPQTDSQRQNLDGLLLKLRAIFPAQ